MRVPPPGDVGSDMARVLCYLHNFAGGGVERMGLRLCRAWAADGLDVEVVIGRTEGRLDDEGGAPGADLIWLPFHWLPDPGFSTARFETLWMLFWLPAIVARTRPDILFCAGNTYSVVAVVLRLLFGRRCPVIVAKISNDLDRRDMPQPMRWFYHRWCRIQGRAIHRFVVMSDAMRGEACERLGVAASRVEVIPNPVLSEGQATQLAEAGRVARARRAREPGTGRRFLAVGRLEPQKNLPLLLRAFARGAGPDDRLVILGEGQERRRLEQLVLRLGLAHRVMLPGHSAQLREWIARSDLFVLSSDYEGLPAVLVEALAAGMPIIATDCCRSMRETLAGAGRARLVPVGDEAALANALATFAPAPDTGGRADVTMRFRPETAGRAYRRLFHEILAPREAAARTCEPILLPTDGADFVFPRLYTPRGDLAAGGPRAP